MKTRHVLHLATATLAGMVVPAASFAQQAATASQAKAQAIQAFLKLSKDAQAADPQKAVPVIVQFKTDDQSTQATAVSTARGQVTKHFHASRSIAARLQGADLQKLASDPNVSYVSIDRPLSARQAAPPPAPAPAPAPGAGAPAAPGAAAPAPAPHAAPLLAGPVQSISKSAEFTTDPINAPAVWQMGYDGTGIGVAVIDSGIAPQYDLVPGRVNGQLQRVVYSQSFPSTLSGGTNDAYGHGTHVAGLIAGNGLASYGKQFTRTFRGVAPNANLINLRVLDENGQGSDSSVIEAIETAIALKNTYNIRIINLSLGRPIWESYKQDPLCQAVEAAWKAGIVVVVSAGNSGRNQNQNPEGYGTIEAPGNDPYVITVGAMNEMDTPTVTDDVIASYSSKGPSFIDSVAKPDIVAPGNLVTSLLAPNSTLSTQNPTFFTPQSFYIANGSPNASTFYMPLSGTSMSAGVASGAVALLLQAVPNLTPDSVKALLMYSAQRSYFPTTSTAVDPVTGASYTSHYDMLTVGAGYLDIQATLNNAWRFGYSLPSGSAMSPLVNYNAASNTATLAADPSSIWGKADLAAAPAIYGQNAFTGVVNGSTVLWGKTAIAGSDDPYGFTALWGSTVLWGRGTTDAANALWGDSSMDGQTVLWGRQTTDGQTVLWGRQITDAN